VFDDNPDLDSTVIVDLRGGPFSPGQGWEATTPEIEFTQQLDTGLDRLRVLVADTGGGLAVGTGGLNLDPEEGTPADLEFQSLAAAGTSVRAKLKLTRRGKALLKRRRLRAKLHVTVAGGAPATRTVRLRRTGRSRP
jgi:hypothetical protein